MSTAATATAEPLRVAWFGHGDGRRADGLSSYSRELVRSLRARGTVVRVFCHAQDGTGTEDAVALRALRIRALTVSAPGSMRRVRAELERFRPHVLHTSWSFSQLDGAVARVAHALGAVTVGTFHLPCAIPGSARAQVLRALYRAHRRNLMEYDRILALSDDQRSLLIRTGYPADRVEVVHNAVDADAFSPGPSALRAELGAGLVVAYLGRLDPEKRAGALVESFLARRWPEDHLLLLAGAGVHEGRLQRRAQRHGQVRMLGMLTTLEQRIDLLRAADIYVLPSTAEGLALSMLEAMSTGCAVIATDAGEDGTALAGCGVVLPVHPLEPRLGEALELLRRDPALRARYGAAARQRVLERYAMRAHLDRVLAVYATLRAQHDHSVRGHGGR